MVYVKSSFRESIIICQGEKLILKEKVSSKIVDVVTLAFGIFTVGGYVYYIFSCPFWRNRWGLSRRAFCNCCWCWLPFICWPRKFSRILPHACWLAGVKRNWSKISIYRTLAQQQCFISRLVGCDKFSMTSFTKRKKIQLMYLNSPPPLDPICLCRPAVAKRKKIKTKSRPNVFSSSSSPVVVRDEPHLIAVALLHPETLNQFTFNSLST